MHVLVTGGYGWTAESIVRSLVNDGHAVSALDVPSTTPVEDIQRLFSAVYLGDISDYAFVKNAMTDVDAVVHLAVAIGENDYNTPTIPYRTNVRGTANIFEAARMMPVPPRIVLMGSATVHLEHATRIHARDDQSVGNGSDFMYDFTKVLQEVIARQYCHTFGLTAVVLRAGHIVDGVKHVDPKGRPLAMLDYARGGWVCRYDVARAVQQAITYDATGYDAFHIIGATQAREQFDIEYTERVLGHINDVAFGEYPPR